MIITTLIPPTFPSAAVGDSQDEKKEHRPTPAQDNKDFESILKTEIKKITGVK